MFGLITQIGLKLGAHQPRKSGFTIDLADSQLGVVKGTDGSGDPLTWWNTSSPAHAAGLFCQQVQNVLKNLGQDVPDEVIARLGLNNDEDVDEGESQAEAASGEAKKVKGCYLKIWQVICRRLAQAHGGPWLEIADALEQREAEIAQALKVFVLEKEPTKSAKVKVVPPGMVEYRKSDYFALTWEGQEISLLPEYRAMLDSANVTADKVLADRTLQGFDGQVMIGNVTSTPEGYNLGANINVKKDTFTDSWGLSGNAVERHTLEDKIAQRYAWWYLQSKKLIANLQPGVMLAVIVEKDGVVDTLTSQHVLQVLRARKDAEFLTLERVEEGFQVHIGVFVRQNKQLVMLHSWQGLSAASLVQRAEGFRKQFGGKTLYNLMRASSPSVTIPGRGFWESTDSRGYGVWLNRMLFGARITMPEVRNAVFVLEHPGKDDSYADLYKWNRFAARVVVDQWLKEGNIMDVTQELGYKLGWLVAIGANIRARSYTKKGAKSLAKSIQTQFDQLQYQRNPQAVFARLLHLVPDSLVRESIFRDRYENVRSEAVAGLEGVGGTFVYRVAFQEGLAAARREKEAVLKKLKEVKGDALAQLELATQEILESAIESDESESVTEETDEGQE